MEKEIIKKDKSLTNKLLLAGVVVGPLYLTVGLIEAFTRKGFDITRHPLSILSNGDLGWIHMTDLILSGILVLITSVGIRRALTGRGKTWAPILIGIYGLGLVLSGFFKADPALGFPPGTPANAMTISTSGMLHFMMGGIGFFGLIAACFVFARRFTKLKQKGWAKYSLFTGIIFFAAFVGIASGSGNGWTILGFWIGIILAWTWLSLLSLKFLKENIL